MAEEAEEVICSETDITELVHAFYARVRKDPVLSPVFNAHIAEQEWPPHLARMVDFWSSVLCRTGRYSGSPASVHIALPGLSMALFRHWLALFEEVALQHPNRALAEEIIPMSRRMAQSLWRNYELAHQPDAGGAASAEGVAGRPGQGVNVPPAMRQGALASVGVRAQLVP